ncbi:MAG: EF-hand domain-containing protein [Planctomycetota bacterium]
MDLIASSSGSRTGQADPSAMRQRMQEAMFKQLDADGNGSISKDEFAAMKEKMPPVTSASADGDIFTQADSDGDGALSRTEWAGLGDKMRAIRDAQMFKDLDTDGNGVLSSGEFAVMQEKMKARMSETGETGNTGSTPAVGDVFGEADTDGDGSLSLEEFSALGAKRGGPPPGPPPGGAAGGAGAAGSAIETLLDALNSNDESEKSEAVNFLDTDGDGKVSLKELLAGLQKYVESMASGSETGANEGTLNVVA